MNRDCVISPCGRYRYCLEQTLHHGTGTLVWLMLNPSTADASKDDATIRKVRGFTSINGYRRWVVVNLFAHRETDAKVMRAVYREDAQAAIGPDNDAFIREMSRGRDVICAWGPKAWVYPRARDVVRSLRAPTDTIERPHRLMCLGVSKRMNLMPLHPLMLPYASQLAPFMEEA